MLGTPSEWDASALYSNNASSSTCVSTSSYNNYGNEEDTHSTVTDIPSTRPLLINRRGRSSSSSSIKTDDTKTETASIKSSKSAHSFLTFRSVGSTIRRRESQISRPPQYSSSSSSRVSNQNAGQHGNMSAKDLLFKSLTFVTMIPRISSARSELGVVKNGLPAPLYRQKKVLEDLLELTKDDLPNQMRRSSLKLIHFSFTNLVQDIFTGCTRKRFLTTLEELCSDELPYLIRKQGLEDFNYMVGAAASLGRKNFAHEHEDCRAVLHILQSSTHVSIELTACAYVWLVCKIYREQTHIPISESELREICFKLINLTHAQLPVEVRRDAADWLWRLENIRCSGLTKGEREELWANLFSLSLEDDEGYSEKPDPMTGLQRLWWFSILKSWTSDLVGDQRIKEVGEELFKATKDTEPFEIRSRAFELISLFSNLPSWSDMFDYATWKFITQHFVDFCMHDTNRVDKDRIMSRVQLLMMESASAAEEEESILAPEPQSTSKELVQLQSRKRVSIIFTREYKQILAACQTVKQHCGPESASTIEASIENLSVFTLPGESVLIMKDQQAILYDRIFNYSKLEATRAIAIQAMYVLMTIQEWMSKISFALGPPC